MGIPEIACKTCDGTGLWRGITCFNCNGTGTIDEVLHGALLRLDSAIKKRNYLNLLIKEGT